jgi:hypothetical protein
MHERRDSQRRYYSEGSAARQVYERDERSEDTARAHERQGGRKVRRRVIKRRKVKPVVVKDIQAKHRHNFLSYVILAAFFGAVIGILSLNAMLNLSLRQLEDSNTALAAIQESNMAREGEIAANLVNYLDDIEEYAVKNLGMIPPEPHQKVEIAAPRQGIVVRRNETSPNQSRFSFDRFSPAQVLDLLRN